MNSIEREKIESHNLDPNSMNKELRTIYAAIPSCKLKEIEEYNESEKGTDFQMTNPYLITVSQNYYEADIKIMFIMKETNGWGNELGNEQEGDLFALTNIPDKLMNLYDIYSKKGGDNNPVWNLFKDFKKQYQGKNVCFIVNNLFFIGYRYGRTGTCPQIEQKFDDILKKEINICKPNLIVFFTHKDHDVDIFRKLGKGSLRDTNIDIVKEIVLDNPLYENLKIFRTNHPQGLKRKAKQFIKEEIDKYVNNK